MGASKSKRSVRESAMLPTGAMYCQRPASMEYSACATGEVGVCGGDGRRGSCQLTVLAWRFEDNGRRGVDDELVADSIAGEGIAGIVRGRVAGDDLDAVGAVGKAGGVKGVDSARGDGLWRTASCARPRRDSRGVKLRSSPLSSWAAQRTVTASGL